jgi:glucose/arabinose dehydrogenase
MRLPGRAGGRFALLAAILALAGCGSSAKSPRSTVFARGLRNVSAFALDARGRLWATTSAAADHKSDGVYLVSGGKPVKVISGLKGPLGLTWNGNELFVASIGRVDAFSDLQGTRFTRRRLVLKEPSGHGWNDNLVKAPDGRLIMSISANCDHCTPRSPWSGSIVSFKPDGSDVHFYARHLRAGYGLAFYPGTSDLLVSMNQRNDLGARTTGDSLGLVRDGDDWGFPACYGQGGRPCAGVPNAIAVLDKHAAAGGLAVLGNVAYVTEWQLGKVLRVQLRKNGAGYTGTVTPFLTGLKNPLALITASDGALLVGDWGSGTIYRVARSS